MKKLTISMNTENSAFEGNTEYEVARILREIADKIEQGHEPTKVMDINGNKVGEIEIKE